MSFTPEFIVSFLSRLVESPAPAHARHLGPCQLWTGARTSWGYGHLVADGVDYMTHAIGFELYHGRLPRGEVIRHLCGRPLCAAGPHLLDGTHKENLADAVVHGTHVPPPHPRCAAHPGAVLTLSQVKAGLARLRAREVTQEELARETGVSQVRWSQLLHGKGWRGCR
jgi:hypothetical protein